ncbi:hypothetical protein CFOL_v3_17020 [Cephalotus follicularis]|uniref:Uncharacterized protein n=1 Tax=Cephalotus follicularis TaxID=3775 RepID=A0A1Q3BZY4_CEPFO|nr:hypothetical protein CFOL_v3_17020 [Cephalotus follicularis]
MGLHQTDCNAILSQIKHQEKQLILKRRWLMGLPISKSESGEKLRKPKFSKHRSLPESFMREDDIFCETIKTHVEEAFGACASERENNSVEDCQKLFDTPDITKVLVSSLDSLTNQGLYRIVMIFTGGSAGLEKTRKKMKKFIRESLPNNCRHHNDNLSQKEIYMKLSLLLNDPKNFRENCLPFMRLTFESHRVAATKLLDRLEDLPTQTLLAMHRNLRGVRGGIQLKTQRHGWTREKLIHQVRKTSDVMLSELGKGDELQEPLSKAMAVAALSLELNGEGQDSSVNDFHQFSSELKSLQNEIVKAIYLLKTKVRFPELKTLKLLLDPNADVSNRCLRTAVRKMLTEYLFQCSNMHTLPNSLLEALAIINRSSRSAPHRRFPKGEIEEEVECILSVSAQAKQVLLDILPDYEFEHGYTDAYMEELEESDDGDGYDDGGGDDENDDCQPETKKFKSSRSHSVDIDYSIESTGESMPVDSRAITPIASGSGHPPCLTPNMKIYGNFAEKLEHEHFTRVASDSCCNNSSSPFLESRSDNGKSNSGTDQIQVCSIGKYGSSRIRGIPVILPNEKSNGDSFERHEVKLETGVDLGNPLDFFASDFSSGDVKFSPSEQSTHRNQYLAVQEVCDKTSMVAYDLIGCILEKFALEQGLGLDLSDTLYLRGGQVAKEKQSMPEDNVGSAMTIQAVEELMPYLPKGGIERLKELIGT